MAGRSVTLRCPATGRPTPLVTWKRDGVPLLQHARYHVSLTAGMLLISATDPSDAGIYRCTATSPIGEDSTTIRLDVQREWCNTYILCIVFILLHRGGLVAKVLGC
ncbi:hypothetical protein HPB51_020026 [Rhipicephalus microplus]|uniref:Ig-like domain-containing protein n=1 Tax=Rhipicephalus microplus TaxID=6941 RepID=A0A9J6EBL6_RHIMP|nr:hypothetical protein HPB51_020026 [Rhipicephalus microplus]